MGIFRRPVVPEEVVQQILDIAEGTETDFDGPAVVPYTPRAAALVESARVPFSEARTSLVGAIAYLIEENVKLAICGNLQIVFVDKKTLREVIRKKGRDNVGNWTNLWNMMIAERYKVMKIIIKGIQLKVKEEYEDGIRRR